MAPELMRPDSQACVVPTAELEVGFVTNVVDADPDTTGTQATMDGIDLGWRTTSTADLNVNHHFSGVANGTNMKVTGPGAGDGTDVALDVTNTSVGPAKYSPAFIVDTGTDANDPDDDTLPCATDPYDGTLASQLDMPEKCFRVSAVGKSNYVGGYTLELEAKGSAVTWGKVAWEEDPFEDLTCDSVMIAAADHVDVCDLFMDEAAAALEDGWAGSKGNAVTFSALTGRADWLEMFTFSAPASATSRQFATLWFNTTEGGKATTDMYADADPGRGDRCSVADVHFQAIGR